MEDNQDKILLEAKQSSRKEVERVLLKRTHFTKEHCKSIIDEIFGEGDGR